MKAKLPRKYNCLICNTECITKDKRSKICHSNDCILKYNKILYSLKKYKIKCIHCGTDFYGKYRETNCEQCKNKIVPLYTETFTRNILCKKCLGIIEPETLKFTKLTILKDKPGKNLCNKCLQQSRDNLSINRRGNNNPNWSGGYVRPNYQRISDEEKRISYDKMSYRMKLNNPMFSPITCDKVSKTFKQKIKDGLLVYKAGKYHHAWKGNRDRAQTIRSRLYKPWIFPIFVRDNFTCQSCGKNKRRLEVHHNKESFKDILGLYLNGKSLSDMSYEEFEKISVNVIKYHTENSVSGVTYCMACHKKHDPKRK